MKKVKTYCLVTTCALFGKECKQPGYPTITGTKMSIEEAKKKFPNVEFCGDYREKPKVIILDDNPLSIASYLEEFGDIE
jgi:hypothetical protein